METIYIKKNSPEYIKLKKASDSWHDKKVSVIGFGLDKTSKLLHKKLKEDSFEATLKKHKIKVIEND